MKKLFATLILLAACFSVRASNVTATLTITNMPTNGFTLTVKGQTFYWTNGVPIGSFAVQITNTTGGDATNLFYASALQVPFNGVSVTQSNNVLTFTGVNLTASVSSFWATLTMSTQTTTGGTNVVVPLSSISTLTSRTNVASQLAHDLADYATYVIPATAPFMANFVSSNQSASILTNNNNFTKSNTFATIEVTNLYFPTNASNTAIYFDQAGLGHQLAFGSFTTEIGAAPTNSPLIYTPTFLGTVTLGAMKWTNNPVNGYALVMDASGNISAQPQTGGGGGGAILIAGYGQFINTNGSIYTIAPTNTGFLPGTNTWTGTNDFTGGALKAVGSYITGLLPTNISAGTISSAISMTNTGNAFTGDGSGLTNVPFAGLKGGTNNNNFTFGGTVTFTGSGTGNFGAVIKGPSGYVMQTGDTFVQVTNNIIIQLPANPQKGVPYAIAGGGSVGSNYSIETNAAAGGQTINTSTSGITPTVNGFVIYTFYTADGSNWIGNSGTSF